VTPGAGLAKAILRETETGGQIRVKAGGRVELGSQDYNSFGRLDGKAAGAMAVYLLPGANQLAASKAIYETMEMAKGLFPSDLDYKIVYDTTPAVEASIESIFHTFIEAIILVTLVVLLFLQNLRATIIPLLTVPVSPIGTFIFFPVPRFSINPLFQNGPFESNFNSTPPSTLSAHGTLTPRPRDTMAGYTPGLTTTDGPDSGTGELTGLAGTMTIQVAADGAHYYEFDYSLPAKK